MEGAAAGLSRACRGHGKTRPRDVAGRVFDSGSAVRKLSRCDSARRDLIACGNWHRARTRDRRLAIRRVTPSFRQPHDARWVARPQVGTDAHSSFPATAILWGKARPRSRPSGLRRTPGPRPGLARSNCGGRRSRRLKRSRSAGPRTCLWTVGKANGPVAPEHAFRRMQGPRRGTWNRSFAYAESLGPRPANPCPQAWSRAIGTAPMDSSASDRADDRIRGGGIVRRRPRGTIPWSRQGNRASDKKVGTNAIVTSVTSEPRLRALPDESRRRGRACKI